MKKLGLRACGLLFTMALAACGGSSDGGGLVAGAPSPSPSPSPAPAPAPTSSLNRCVDPAYMALPTGWNTSAAYAVTGAFNADETVTTTIDGLATFEGASRTQITSTTNQSMSLGGISSDTVSVSKGYYQAAADVITRYGFATTSTTTMGGMPGPTSAAKQVYTPAIVEQMYTLALGQSYTQTEVVVVTVTAPTPKPPETITTTTTVTYVADETIPVLGKTYDTCKVELKADTQGLVTAWILAGKGVQVKLLLQAPDGSVTQLTELKSGTHNGTPL